jgi:hypothetical protein
MKITLRKANAVQLSINDALKSIDTVTNIRVNEFQDAEREIRQASEKLFSNLNRKEKLNIALYEIRKAVGRANAQVGIDDKLADIAHLDKGIQLYSAFVTAEVRESPVVLTGKLEKIRNRKDDSRVTLYGREDDVTTSILSEDDVAGFKRVVAKAKKSKQKIQDEVLELNVRTEIEVSAETAATLEAEGLI